MQDEIYDVIDKRGNKIGTATWTEVHTKGLLHQAVSVLIFKDSSKKEFLLQRRSKSAAQSPGVWQHAAAGHVKSGDTLDDTARKELQEELFCGHTLPFLELRRLGSFFNHDLPGNYEIVYLYETIYPGPFFHSPEEVAEPPKWVHWDKLLVDMELNPNKYAEYFFAVIREYRKYANPID